MSGGLVPSDMRGKKLDGLAALWDWYGTFAGLAGADPTDKRAAARSTNQSQSPNVRLSPNGVLF